MKELSNQVDQSIFVVQVLNGKEDALHLASQHTQIEENQRSMRGFLCPVQPSQNSDFQPMPGAGAIPACLTGSFVR